MNLINNKTYEKLFVKQKKKMSNKYLKSMGKIIKNNLLYFLIVCFVIVILVVRYKDSKKKKREKEQFLNYMKNKTLIIAEAGVNHDGDIEKAFHLVNIAKKAKADFVKFQTFNTNDLASKDVEKAKYQNNFDSEISHYEMLKKLEFSKADFRKIINHCKKQNIRFFPTYRILAFKFDRLDPNCQNFKPRIR